MKNYDIPIIIYSLNKNTFLSVNIKDETILIKITNLPIGDFIITENLDDNSGIKLAIERKSLNDLYSSIIDGRFREQKSRLLDSIGETSKICYLIEGTLPINVGDGRGTLLNGGTFDKLITNKKSNMIRGSILNLIFKHNYRVLQTKNKVDTFDNILALYKKFASGDFSNTTSIQQGGVVKLIRRSENIKQLKLLNQLCLIPGVSPTIANAIIDWLKQKADTDDCCIKTIIDLYNDYNKDDKVEEFDNLDKSNLGELLFADVIISPNQSQDTLKDTKDTKRVRKVGKALSKKIYEYFCT